MKNLLYPECLENSKVISIIDFKSLDFKLEDFLNLKEVKKITDNKEDVMDAFKEINFIKESNNNENTFNIIIDEEIKEIFRDWNINNQNNNFSNQSVSDYDPKIIEKTIEIIDKMRMSNKK